MNGTRRIPLGWIAAASAVCLFLITLGAKWAVFSRYGSPMPDWDQWDAEALGVLIPWFEGREFLRELFNPHNEHRVVITKLQTLALTVANGQWDSRLLAVFNAVLHSTIAASFWLMLRRWVAARWQPAIFVLILGLFALPFAWQNILGGFHSQQYWLVGLSVAAMAVLPFARPWSGAWWAAALAAAVALLTMGSGFLAATAVMVVIVFRVSRRQVSWREARPTLALGLAIVGVGLLTRAEHPGHDGLKAQSIQDFVLSTLRSMEWPLRERDWAGPILWLPWAVLLWRVFATRADSKDQRGAQTIAALGGWAMLQILATAYARGVGADYPASRYMDTLAIGALANGSALAWLASEPALRRKARLGLGALAVAWVALLVIGLHREVDNTFRFHLPGARKYYNNAENHLRGYLATNDAAHLRFPDIPYPNADGLMQRLENPHLRSVMPAVIRPPLPAQSAPSSRSFAFIENVAMSVRPDEHSTHGLAPGMVPLDYVRTWGSFGANGLATTGEWRSAPLRSPLGAWLKFETAGDLGREGVALELRDAASGELLASVKPSRIPGNAWRAAYVPAPAGEFIIVARDGSPTRWMAFGAPVELGTLSYWAWRLAKHGPAILYPGIAGSAALLLIAIVVNRGRRRRDAAPAAPTASPNDMRCEA